jgi:hypothetical protein
MASQKTWLAVVVCTACLAGCSKSPESSVESFYRAVSKGEITEAQGYVSTQLIGMLGLQKFSAALANETERIRACGGIKDISVKLQGEGEIRSGTTTVTYGGNCPVKTESTRLIKEDGKWKITAGK